MITQMRYYIILNVSILIANWLIFSKKRLEQNLPNRTKDNKSKLEQKIDLIADMVLTLCGRNLEIGFGETQEFKRKYEAIESDK